MVARSLSRKGLSNWTVLSVNVSFGVTAPGVVASRDGVDAPEDSVVGRVAGSEGSAV